MRGTPFSPFGWVVRAAAALALLALAGVMLAIMSQAALIIRAAVGDPAPTAAPLPTPPRTSPPAEGTGGVPPLPPRTLPSPPPAGGGGGVAEGTGGDAGGVGAWPTDGAPPSGDDTAALQDALMMAWQCDRARRGLPALVRDPALDAAAAALQRAALTEGRAALEAAAARYYEVSVGALPMARVTALRCDAPLPDATPPTDSATRRVGLAVIPPPPGAAAPNAPVSFVLIGMTEERAP
jgi:hypothetical protein